MGTLRDWAQQPNLQRAPNFDALYLYCRDLHFLNTSAFCASRLHFSPHTLATAVDGVAALPPAGLFVLVVGDETTTVRCQDLLSKALIGAHSHSPTLSPTSLSPNPGA